MKLFLFQAHIFVSGHASRHAVVNLWTIWAFFLVLHGWKNGKDHGSTPVAVASACFAEICLMEKHCVQTTPVFVTQIAWTWLDAVEPILEGDWTERIASLFLASIKLTQLKLASALKKKYKRKGTTWGSTKWKRMKGWPKSKARECFSSIPRFWLAHDFHADKKKRLCSIYSMPWFS